MYWHCRQYNRELDNFIEVFIRECPDASISSRQKTPYIEVKYPFEFQFYKRAFNFKSQTYFN